MDFSSITQHPDHLVIRLAGELDVESADRLTATVEAAMADSGRRAIVVDLADITFIDSTGIGALLSVRNAAVARDVALVLRGPSAQVRRVLQIANLDTVFEIRD